MLPRLDEVKQILQTHYIVNVLLSISFLVVKGTILCGYIFIYETECEIDSREREILMFLAVMIVWKGRKSSNWLHYLSTAFMFAKLANLILFARVDLISGIVYGVTCLVAMLLFPEPAYNGPEKVTYFMGSELFDELAKKNGTTWIVEFYTSWSPECRHIAPVFAKLSEELTLSNLRFGKLDIGRWPNESNRFYVNNAANSKQLPTICVFRDGKEIVRRPQVKQQKAIPFVFTQENCVKELGLWGEHEICKERLSKRRGNKKEE